MTNLTDEERALGGARTYSQADMADYLRKRDMPEYQQERDTKYRFMTPQVIDQYTRNMNPRDTIPMGIGASMQERDARMWRTEQSAGPAPGSVVGQMLAGTKTDAGQQTPTGVAPATAWGGTMRPISLAPGENLLDKPPPYTGVENDPVLAERRAEFDRNLPEYLQRPFQSRADFERGITQIPGAGQEILGHIQQRAMESMPAGMREEWQQSQANRAAIQKEQTAMAAQNAAYQNFQKTATPEQQALFNKNYENTPMGWKKITRTPEEKRASAITAIEETAAAEYANMGPDEEMYDLTGGQIGALPKIVKMNKTMGKTMAANPLAGIMKPYVPPGVPPRVAPAPIEDKRGFFARNNPFQGSGSAPSVAQGATPGAPPAAAPTIPTTAPAQAPAQIPEAPPPAPEGSGYIAAPGKTVSYNMEGRVAKHPQTGHRIIFRNGKWEPMQ